MVNRGRQLPEPKPVTRSQSFLRKLRGKDSGKPETPIRNVFFVCFEIVPTDYNPYLFELIKEILPLMPK